MAKRQSTFLLKRSNVPGKIPLPGDIKLGEIALNTSDVILYTSGTTANDIIPIGWDRVHRTGDTVTGNFVINGGLTANTISATTYLNLPLSTTTLQQAYNNSVNPEIVTNSTLGGVQFKGGTGSNTDKNIIVENNTSSETAFIRADGYGGFSTISATTYVNLPTSFNSSYGSLTTPQAYNIDRYYTFGFNTTTVYVSGLATGVAMGTPTTVFLAGSSTIKIPRCRFNSNVSSNSTCGYRGANSAGASPTDFCLGTGFYTILNFTFGTESTYNSNSFLFAGLSGTLNDTLIGASAVSSLLNIIGVGSAPADSFMSIFHNDGSGVATKIPLNATNFPSNRTAGAANTKFYSLELYNAFGGSTVQWRITSISGTTQLGQESGTITTNLPSNTTLLSFWAGRTNGATASSVEMSISSLQGWTLY
jgi:hypothetical protein